MLESMESKRSRDYLNVLGAIVLAAGLLSAAAAADAAGKPNYAKKMQMGQLLYFNGNVDSAIKAFKTASSLKPDAFEPHLNLVNIYVQKQDFPAAVEECREGLKIKPKHRDLHLILGNLLRTVAGNKEKDSEEQKKLLEEATKELATAEELGANKALIHSTLSVIHVQQGNFDKAMEHVNIALDEKDKLPDAHLIKGVLHFKKGDKEKSLAELEKAIEQKEKNAEARNTKADILFSMGKVDESLAEYEKALEDDPKYHQSMMGIANILISRKEWETALVHLEKAQEHKPDDSNIIYSIAICLEKLGKVQLAIPKYNEGIMVDTNPTTKAQILAHVRELQQKQLLNIPSLLNPATGTPIGPGAQGSTESSLFGFGNSFFGESFKDMIKIKGGSGVSGGDGEKDSKKEKAKSKTEKSNLE